MKKGIIAAIVAIALVAIGAAVYWAGVLRPNGPPGPAHTQQANQATTGTKQAAASPAERYCAEGHDKHDTQALAKAGGLVQIFQHEAALADAYGCAAAYLKHGGDVNELDPRADSEHLTPLLFAIKRNDPKMVRFMLDHDADPTKRGGPKKIKPYGYAVFQALHNRSTDYNAVIDALNSALGDHPASSGGS